MGILEKISEIEKEIARTQKNKGKLYIRLVFFQICFENNNLYFKIFLQLLNII